MNADAVETYVDIVKGLIEGLKRELRSLPTPPRDCKTTEQLAKWLVDGARTKGPDEIGFLTLIGAIHRLSKNIKLEAAIREYIHVFQGAAR